MLTPGVADIAKQFIKDGMKLHEAVLAAHRLMGEKLTPEVKQVLDKAAKHIEKMPVVPAGSIRARSYSLPYSGEMKQVHRNISEYFAAEPPSRFTRKMARRREIEEYFTPTYAGKAARDYALKQLGLK